MPEERRLFIGLYKSESTDRVVVFEGGRRKKDGRGTLFLILPWRTFARIPTTDVPVTFGFTELGSDNLGVNVQGTLQIRFKEELLDRRDFTVDPWTDTYLSEDPKKVRDEATHALQTVIREEIRRKDITDNLTGKTELQQAVTERLRVQTELFASIGIEFVNVFITAVRPGNRQLEAALEAEAREKLLAQNANQMAETRRAAAEDDRRLRQYEAETDRKLEEDRAQLIAVRNQNVIAEAQADAEATKKRLAAYEDADAATLLALAFEKMAENGVGQFNVTPEVLAALGGARRTN